MQFMRIIVMPIRMPFFLSTDESRPCDILKEIDFSVDCDDVSWPVIKATTHSINMLISYSLSHDCPLLSYTARRQQRSLSGP
ncbi:hypothetical protein EB796_011627 [Bugula neritina]|uniref:Uncharacterized protein n=1 Tax=Bugula neritina TaxID=10212 RepID=A0A7J7JXJ9_BUGNE|nr:hypothetical protein EB796_011627 [Bugula neritina]